jgi:hypothetical protein
MTLVLIVLVMLAALSLGLRTTSVLMAPATHPMDRLAFSVLAGTLLAALVFEIATTYRIFDFGLGLMLSLAPVGLFDLVKWWFRSRGRRSGWLRGSAAPGWIVTLRWAFLVGAMLTVTAIGRAMTTAAQ